MFKSVKKFLIILVAAALITLPLAGTASAQGYNEEEEPSGTAMIADLVVVRPLGIVTTIAGCVLFVLSSPFSAMGDNIDTAKEKLINEPAAYTFKRPLGEFE